MIDFKFSTVSTSASPTLLSGSPVVSVYKSNSLTESTAGVTLTTNFDSVVGLNHVHITTVTDGTFYADGNDFDVVITTGTVGGKSVVGMIVGGFSLSNRSALRPVTAGRQLVVDSAGLGDANVVKLGPTGSGTAQTARDIGASVLVAAGQFEVKKNTALSNFSFPMYDSTGALKTGLTVSATRKIDAGAFGATTNSPTEIANGLYTIDLSAADLNGTTIALRFAATGAVDTNILIVTQA